MDSVQDWTKRKRICGWRLKREINTLSSNWLLVLILRLWWSGTVVIIHSILQPKLCVYVHLITVQSGQGVILWWIMPSERLPFWHVIDLLPPSSSYSCANTLLPKCGINNPWLKYYNNRLIFIRRTRDTEDDYSGALSFRDFKNTDVLFIS